MTVFKPVIRVCTIPARRNKKLILLVTLITGFIVVQSFLANFGTNSKKDEPSVRDVRHRGNDLNSVESERDYKVDRHVLSHNQAQIVESDNQFLADDQESLKAPRMFADEYDKRTKDKPLKIAYEGAGEPLAPTVPGDKSRQSGVVDGTSGGVYDQTNDRNIPQQQLNKLKLKPQYYYDSNNHMYDSYGHNNRVGNDHGINKANQERKKVKQWETFDYEDPYNLLEIHIDRAADHLLASGQPWPMPQEYSTSYTTFPINMDKFNIKTPTLTCDRIDRAIQRYTKLIHSKGDLFIPDGEQLFESKNKRRTLSELSVEVTRPCRDGDLPHEHMSEQYKLSVDDTGARLSAQEPWGIIRGLETFSQLIYYQEGYAVLNATYIKDFPRFRFRGLMLDTARHFMPVATLKRTLDAMSFNKLNVFHWHMTDDQSFPFVSRIFPKLSSEGAYSPRETYSPKEVANLIQYAADRAIRVIPEFDTPGHTRSWGMGYPELLTNCSAHHHPFGALNPIQNTTYQFMADLWQELHDVFPDNYVHVGGDEINYKCWLHLKEIRDFMLKNNMTKDNYDFETLDGDSLQGYFLKRLLDVMPKDRKKIAWEEAFVSAQVHNVSTDELIINVWKGGDFEWQYTIENVIRRGYKAIMSACWYLNYISYGRDWNKYYECDPHSFLMYSQGADTYKESVLGGQVCMWAEFIDATNLEPTLWPRAIAPAEKLWSSSMLNDWRRAEPRFEQQRCRMLRRGIKAQPISGPGSCIGQMKIKPPFDGEL